MQNRKSTWVLSFSITLPLLVYYNFIVIEHVEISFDDRQKFSNIFMIYVE